MYMRLTSTEQVFNVICQSSHEISFACTSDVKTWYRKSDLFIVWLRWLLQRRAGCLLNNNNSHGMLSVALNDASRLLASFSVCVRINLYVYAFHIDLLDEFIHFTYLLTLLRILCFGLVFVCLSANLLKMLQINFNEFFWKQSILRRN